MAQSAAKRKQKLERMLEEAGFIGQFIHTATDEELRRVDGVGPAAVKEIRKFWPPPADQPPEEKPEPLPPVAVYDFGLSAASEKQKRRGIWHDMSKIFPELWGQLELRIRSGESEVVIARLDRINRALLAGQPGSEQLLGKVREEVKLDSGDRALSEAVMAAAIAILPSAFGVIRRRSQQQDIEYTWRQALAHVAGMRGTARFADGEQTFTGKEPEKEIQKLLEPVMEYSPEHQHPSSILTCVTRMKNADAAEMVRLGEAYVVTELHAGASSDSVARMRMLGRGR